MNVSLRIKHKGWNRFAFSMVFALVFWVQSFAQIKLSAGCTTNTADLSSIGASNTPSGTSLTWHSGTPATTANKLSSLTAVAPGTYYAAFFDAANSCYSSAQTTVTVTSAFCISNICPATTANLTTAISASGLPSGTTLTWHTGIPATDANKLTNAQAIAAGAGSYYAAVYDATGGCYSGNGLAVTEVIVQINICTDTDGDGVADVIDLDDDNDGIPDTVENAQLTADIDGDGIPNSLDLDSDNDGISDLMESGNAPAILADTNGDGTISNTESAAGANGIPLAAESGTEGGVVPTAVDTDGDIKADPYDLDSDNDGIFDVVEGGNGALDTNNDGIITSTDGGYADVDSDGIPDGTDSNTAVFGGTDTPSVIPDSDGDGIKDFRELDSDNDGIKDLVESGYGLPDTNADGKVDGTDTDGDGLVNVPTLDANATFGGGVLNEATLTDANTNGTPDYQEVNNPVLTIVATSATNPEGNSGTTPFTFTVTRTNNTTGATTVNYAVTGSGANAANAADFGGTLPSGTVSFTAGETTKTITVNVSGDVTIEPTETFTVTLSNPSSPATITTATAIGTITNDDLLDSDGDGVPDITDLDDDNDGILDTVEDAQANMDIDGDGIPNRLDLDSDNDGISDLLESGNPGIIADVNNDGTISALENPVGANGIPLAAENGVEGGTVPTAVDTDGDGKKDPYDLDSDNDGIFDVVEGGNGALDTNNDGVITSTDTGYADVDGDGIADGTDSNTAVFGGTDTPSVIPDSDGDGIKDFRELDSDNDGIKDLVESGYGLPDTNADGKVDGTDTDGDGLVNVPILDANATFGGGSINEATLTDANNNSIPDYQEAKDTDGDGVPDITDLDDDNDGILDTVEDAQLTADIDGDGIPNSLDLDSDNDGINDVIEAGGTDANKDGIADGTPNATTGIPASAGAGLTPPDTDGDTRPNPYDLDSDNDGINDLVESGNSLLVDANGDGKVDGTDPDGDGILGAADGVPAVRGDTGDPSPANTDGTDNPNYTDLDSDNDGLTDLVESGIPNPATLDANGDGKIDNAADTDGDGIPQVVDGAPSVFGDANNPTLPDANSNGKPDYVDALDTDGDGVPDITDLDDDNDGILDTVENAQLTADIDGDGIPNSLDLDSDNDGINDVIEAGGTDANKDGIADGTPNATTGIPASAGAGLTPPDTDGDTRPNPYDLDSDNDGINDLVESGNPLLVDADGNGIVDGTDPDGDGILGAADGVPAVRGDTGDPSPANTDGTDNPNYTDLDSDNDGLTDLVESGIPNPATLDANGDGKIDNPADADGDGIPQLVDGAPSVFGDANNPTLPDSDSNGTPDYVQGNGASLTIAPTNATNPEGNSGTTPFTFTVTRSGNTTGATTVDYAVTGVANAADFNGILPSGTVSFAAGETSKVITINVSGDLAIEPDETFTVTLSNASGTATIGTATAIGTITNDDFLDTDGDGIPDMTDLDDDNDGILDTVEDAQLTADIDSDGIPNSLDLDSDNDGINDVIEAGGTDSDKDGIADGTPNPTTGIPASAGSGSTPPDTDGDTRPNPYDLDSDNDGINDLVESGNPLLVDANGDGKVDGTDPDGDGILGAADGVPATRGDTGDPSPANTDGTDNPNYTDLDSDNDGLTDLVESGIPNPATLDANGDGKIDNPADTDGDGIPQVVDGAPSVFGDANNPTLPDSDSNGTPDYVQGNGASLTIAPTNATNPEGNSGTTPFTFTVTRSGNTTGSTTVNWAVTGSGTNPADATDFGGTLPTGTVSFAAGETTKTITVNVSGDATVEPNETFTVTLSSPSGAATLTTATATGTITNDDVVSAGVKLAVKVFLQGAYDSVAYTMRDDLRSRGFIPSAQPYKTALSSRFSQHTGTETVAPSVLAVTGNNAIVDWVYVDLRDANDSTFVVATRAALVQRDGDVVDLDGVSPVLFSSATPASYFISVNHRNHLGALTKQAIALSATVTTVDFTTTALQLAGTYPTKTYTTSGKRALWGGNANSDKKLIFQGPTNDADRVKDDILFALGNPNGDFSYIETGYRQGDINMDGDVKYQGPSNDLDAILFFNIVLYPTNTTYIPIYIMYERIP